LFCREAKVKHRILSIWEAIVVWAFVHSAFGQRTRGIVEYLRDKNHELQEEVASLRGVEPHTFFVQQPTAEAIGILFNDGNKI
jgi:hypothetical protein